VVSLHARFLGDSTLYRRRTRRRRLHADCPSCDLGKGAVQHTVSHRSASRASPDAQAPARRKANARLRARAVRPQASGGAGSVRSRHGGRRGLCVRRGVAQQAAKHGAPTWACLVTECSCDGGGLPSRFSAAVCAFVAHTAAEKGRVRSLWQSLLLYARPATTQQQRRTSRTMAGRLRGQKRFRGTVLYSIRSETSAVRFRRTG
jgi:hypothetical protein